MISLDSLKRTSGLDKRAKTFPQYELPFVNLECVTTENGRYYISPTGKKLTSVTTMLGRSGDHSYLEEWRNRLGAEAADAETERCAVRGEAVHLSCELYLKNHPMEEVNATAGIYLPMFRQLLPHLNCIDKVWGQEIPLYSDILELAGRVDFFGVYQGTPVILDFKTSNQLKTVEMIEDYSIQLCCYSIMIEEMFKVRIDRLINIISNEKSSSPTVIEFQRKDVIAKTFERIRQYRKMDEERGGNWAA